MKRPSWDLTLVLEALRLPPFEPLEQSELMWTSAYFMRACTSDACMCWNSVRFGVALRPTPSFLPKRLSADHTNQAIELSAYAPSCLQGEDAASAVLLSPVRALKYYIQATATFRRP